MQLCLHATSSLHSFVCVYVCVRNAFAKVALAVLGWSRAAKGPERLLLQLRLVGSSKRTHRAQSHHDTGSKAWKRASFFIKHIHTHTVNTYALNVVWHRGLVSKFEHKHSGVFVKCGFSLDSKELGCLTLCWQFNVIKVLLFKIQP